jgi:hypothetical protein
MGQTGNAYRIFVGKPTENGYLEDRRWKVIIKMALREIGCEVYISGSELCPVAGFDISNVELLRSTTNARFFPWG